MAIIYLVKPGELTLKGGNRPYFERVLIRNMAARLAGSGASVSATEGRLFVHCDEPAQACVEGALRQLAGIAGWAQVRVAEKTPEAAIQAAVDEARVCFERGARSFKVEARRADKSFPLRSYELNCQAGAAICRALPELVVDVHSPAAAIKIEVRQRVFVYGASHPGLRGLPVGTAARGMLLLSGGIDSPVAGYLMALRGMHFDAVYFHAYPYTSDKAREKVVTLARILAPYTMGVKLHVVSFTAVQQKIKDGAPESWRTVLLRMAMMECAGRLARTAKCKCLISGESLAQVASQTLENIACAESRAGLPVMRPLIGMDKESITRTAAAIGTYETSILPYQDCCVLFSPPHPVLYGALEEAAGLYQALNLETEISAAVRGMEIEKC
ncbi:MAG: tRNA 4-thiouridine(8) synthase ThiI [Spirochaetaceae bacterium]|nr:tRNA 4-thiouridine(8) synthase ThiI [Spirochaetaceae bacterium]